jgi:hypothetical protein
LIISKIFGIEPIVSGKIVFHIGEKDRNIDNPLPARAGIFQDVADVLENGAALGLNIIGDDSPALIELDAWDLFAATLSGPDAGQK